MIPKIKKLIARFWLLLFFIFIFAFIAAFQISFEQILESVFTLQLWQLAALIVIYFAISICIIVSRKFLILALNQNSTFRNLVLIHFASMAAHYSTPAKIGFPLTVYLLKKHENIPYSCGTALILIELTVNMGICGLLAVSGSLFYFRDYVRSIVSVLIILCVISVAAILVLKLIISRQKSVNRVTAVANRVLLAFSGIAVNNLMIYCLIVGFTQIISAASLIVLCRFFLIDISLWQAVTASTAAFFLGAVSMIPMGIGVREASMILFLNRFGIDSVTGVSIVTIQRLLSTGLSFILGTFFGGYLGVKDARSNIK